MERNRYRVVMLPWLSHSHISSFLELAKRLTTHNFHVYLCSTPINLLNIKKNLAEKHSQSIELVELNLPSSPHLPSHYHTTNGIPTNLNKTLFTTFEKSAPDFTIILQNIRPHLLLYDFNQRWAPRAASSLNIPSVQFLSGSAVVFSVALHYNTKPLGEQYPFPEIYLKDHEIKHMKEANGHIPWEHLDDNDPIFECLNRSCGIILLKSIRELDGKYIEHMSQTLGKKVFHIGPLVQESLEVDDVEHIEIFKWLDKKKESSVVFVSFGSEYFLSDHEIQDIACGLELSNVSFIWVIRFPKDNNNTSVEEVLPHGFLERLGGNGKIIEKWAPQAKILSHSSVGGFVSHCGWGSVMESIWYGVPIIAMPMQYDQPYNARLLMAIGVGIDVGRDADGRLKTEEMAEALKKVVVEEGWGRIREKVGKLGEIMRKRAGQELDTIVIENLVRLCEIKR